MMTLARILLALALVAAAVLAACGNKPPDLDPPSFTISQNTCVAHCWNRNMDAVCWKLMEECGKKQLEEMEKQREREETEAVAKYHQKRPRNGQCPVCGTMAKPVPPDIAPFLKSRHVACEHCNTVFRQWAEGKEPK